MLEVAEYNKHRDYWVGFICCLVTGCSNMVAKESPWLLRQTSWLLGTVSGLPGQGYELLYKGHGYS